jgi:hypothetical protein
VTLEDYFSLVSSFHGMAVEELKVVKITIPAINHQLTCIHASNCKARAKVKACNQ